MDSYILLAIIILLVAIGILLLLVLRKRKVESADVDYRVFFILGISFFPFAIVFIATDIPVGYVFFVLGIVYLVIGLSNRDKWKK